MCCMRSLLVALLASCSFAPGALPGTSATDATADSAFDTPACVGLDSDGDGVNDPCDACPNDSPNDPDGDGVCTSVDSCPAGPDDADEDGDSIANACDDWPCGEKPAAPPAIVTWATANENVSLSTVDVSSMGNRAVVDASSMVSVSASYSIIDCQCTGCIDQIEVGFHTIGKAACLYNGNPQGGGNCSTPTLGVQTRMFMAPSTPGVYELRFNRGNDSSCQANGAWWANVAPGAGNTFALVCVQ